ncbi:MAG: DegT/DnrJ/EryC1/StrS family aminotransferase, partial [Proteobacteria bacterium]|nr:DegT/DnrJ/EryC1/StrS family aminotransferase [Pseudomonadota bacterium]
RRAGGTHVFHQYVLRLSNRADVQGKLREAGIGSGVHYPQPVHLQPAYKGRVALGPAGCRASETAATEVLLLDTLGELVPFYAAGDVAYVGGTLVPIGGHNLLEPAALARPLLAGPYTFNDSSVARLLVEAGALGVVVDAAGLAASVERLLAEPAAAHAAGERGRAAVVANQGALGRLLARVERLLQRPAVT